MPYNSVIGMQSFYYLEITEYKYIKTIYTGGGTLLKCIPWVKLPKYTYTLIHLELEFFSLQNI